MSREPDECTGPDCPTCNQWSAEEEEREEYLLMLREEKRDKMRYANRPKGIRHGRR